METSCQLSYPLNSENASPPGTFTLYLSWADMAPAAEALMSAVATAIAQRRLLLIASFSFPKEAALTASRRRVVCLLESDATGQWSRRAMLPAVVSPVNCTDCIRRIG